MFAINPKNKAWVADALPPLSHKVRDQMTKAEQQARKDRIIEACHTAGFMVRKNFASRQLAEAYAAHQRAVLVAAGIDEQPHVSETLRV